VAVVPIQARQFAQSHRRSAESPFFANFRDSTSSVEESALRKELFAAAPAERRALLETALQREVAQVLRIALRRVDTTTPFGDLGFDSLLAIELRNRLESVLGTTLPTSLLWGHRTIQALAPQLAARLGLELADAPVSALEMTPSTAATTLDELSADELAEQLSLELGRAGNGGR
jgi:acyl carrier protein